MRLVVVVGVAWVLHGVRDQFFERGALADELNEFGNAAAAAKHHEFFLLQKEFFDRATFLLIEQLVDLDVVSTDRTHMGSASSTTRQKRNCPDPACDTRAAVGHLACSNNFAAKSPLTAG